jgi:hypothetical protein
MTLLTTVSWDAKRTGRCQAFAFRRRRSDAGQPSLAHQGRPFLTMGLCKTRTPMIGYM